MDDKQTKAPGSGTGEEDLIYRNNRELFYSFDSKSGFGKKVGYQYGANQEIIRQSWEVAQERLEEVKQRINAGLSSPIAYHMERCLMELPMLAAYMELPKWRVRRHLKPSVYKRLPEKIRQKYASVFGVGIHELDNLDLNHQSP
jgi:hypothetical protein